jgi:hypothetical protein
MDAPHPPPYLTIRLELEARPRVTETAGTAEQAARLQDWIKGNPALHDLVRDALMLATKRAA